MPDAAEASTGAPTRLLYTPLEAAATLGIGRSSLYLLLASGAIPSVRIGGSRRIPAAALHAYVESLLTVEPSVPSSTLAALRSPRPADAAATETPTPSEESR